MRETTATSAVRSASGGEVLKQATMVSDKGGFGQSTGQTQLSHKAALPRG
jgi:hypothetical protein